MPHIVIVGAGPIGLYTAIRLHQSGIRDIEVIDPRQGEYIRPGFVTPKVFNKILRYLNKHNEGLPYRFSPSQAHHIKEVERMLYRIVKKRGISIQSKTFVGFSDDAQKSILLSHKAKGVDASVIESVSVDIVIDATGEKAFVCEKLNQKKGEPYFERRPVFESPLPVDEYVAFVLIPKSDALSLPIDTRKDFPPFFKTREDFDKMRALGWERSRFPFFTMMSQGEKHDKEKVAIYTELPHDYPRSKELEWLSLILSIFTEGKVMAFTPLKPSKKKGKDALRLSHFKLKPKMMTQYGGFDGDEFLPSVVPLGDSQISPIYRLGHGIGDGIDRVEKWLSVIAILGGRVVEVDSGAYEKAVSSVMQRHFDALRLYEKDLLAREKHEGAAFMGGLKHPSDGGECMKKKPMGSKIQLTSATFFSPSGARIREEASAADLPAANDPKDPECKKTKKQSLLV